jgi:hypothetical protein
MSRDLAEDAKRATMIAVLVLARRFDGIGIGWAVDQTKGAATDKCESYRHCATSRSTLLARFRASRRRSFDGHQPLIAPRNCGTFDPTTSPLF